MRRATCAVLMYHKVGAAADGRPDTFLNVPAASFERQMRLLAGLGYRGITFAEAADGLAGGRPIPRRAVCVTFDDGYVCAADHAAPVLARHGWPATVFVPSVYVGHLNRWDETNGRPLSPIMAWDHLRALAVSGWEVAGHTRTHPRLDSMDDLAALDEIRGGKADLESALGIEARTFCYPFGALSPRTPALVKQAGFLAACTTKSGLARVGMDPFLLPRVKIAYRDGLTGFLYRLLIRPYLG